MVLREGLTLLPAQSLPTWSLEGDSENLRGSSIGLFALPDGTCLYSPKEHLLFSLVCPWVPPSPLVSTAGHLY